MNSKSRFIVSISLVCGLAAAGFSACKKGDKKLVARVGAVKIYDQDLSQELVGLPPAYHNYVSTLDGKKQLLDILLREKILLRAAEKSGVAGRKEVQNALKEYHARAEEQEKEFRRNLVLREYLRELQDGELKVTEADLQAYYDQNRSDFESPRKISASHILSPTEEEAQKALQRVRKGEDFAKVAREMSTDPSSARGGSIGEISRGDLADLPEFEQALFALKSGQVSGVVKTKIGYHVIRKAGEISMPRLGFEEAAPQIRRVLEKKKFDQWVDGVKKKEKVFVDEQALASLRIPEPDRGATFPPLKPAN